MQRQQIVVDKRRYDLMSLDNRQFTTVVCSSFVPGEYNRAEKPAFSRYFKRILGFLGFKVLLYSNWKFYQAT